MSKPATCLIRWGILGTGNVAQDFVCGLRQLPDTEIQAVASRTLVNAAHFAKTFTVSRAYERYQDLLNDKDVDVVYVATPNHRHKDDCLHCLGAGKPVLCEKPFALSAIEAREVIETARRERLFCMEAMWMRFLPIMGKLREILANGLIGELRMVIADLGFPAIDIKDNRFFSPELGGGAWFDLGVYTVSLAHFLLGAPDHVVSQATTNDRGVDVQSAAILGYEKGRLALLSSSICSHLSGGAKVIGTRGEIHIHPPLYRPHRLSIFVFPQHPPASVQRSSWLAGLKNNRVLRSVYFRFETLLRPLFQRGPRTVVQPFEGNGYNYEAAEVMRCLRAGKLESPIMPLDETLSVMETMDEVRRQWNCEHVQK